MFTIEDILVIYAIGFLILGVSIFVLPQQNKKSHFILHLPLLAFFGMLHATVEFLTFWQLEHHASGSILNWSIALLLLASFALLFEFGRRMTLISLPGLSNKFKEYSASWLYAILLLLIFFLSIIASDAHLGFVIATRFFVGFPAALLAGFSFWRQFKTAQGDNRSPKLFLFCATFAFLIYGLSTIVMPSSDPNLSSMYVTQEQFINFFDFPVQSLRALCAVVAAFSIVYIVRRLNYEGMQNEIKQMQEIDHLHEIENINKVLIKQAEERRQFEEQLAKSEEHFRLLVENSHDIIYTLNAQGVFTFGSM